MLGAAPFAGDPQEQGVAELSDAHHAAVQKTGPPGGISGVYQPADVLDPGRAWAAASVGGRLSWWRVTVGRRTPSRWRVTMGEFEARERRESFDYAGATVEMVEPATVLAAARVNAVELLRKATWPAPVQRVDLTVASAETADGPVHVFTSAISTATDPMSRESVRKLVLGADPI